MLENLKSDFKYDPAFTAVILILFIGTWSTLYLGLHMDIDMGWLLQCLNRFMDGGVYKADFYETNPPLSFLIYLPAYPLYTYLGIGAKLAVFLTFAVYIAFSNYIMFRLLRKTEYTAADIVIILSALLMAQTWASAIAFGSKDHLILIFLLPLCIYQYFITIKKPVGSLLSISCIIMGAIAICLKPHYGIITALLFLHRSYVTKSVFCCIKSPDFWGLLIGGITYAVFVYLVTPEFYDIVPEVLSLYGIERPYPLSMRFYYLLYGFAGFGLGSWFFVPEKDKALKSAMYGFTLLSLVCFLPYILQDKGFHYHALPILCYGMMSLFLGTYAIAIKIAESKDVAIWSACAIVAMMSFVFTSGGKSGAMTTGQYTAQPLIDMIDERAWNNVYATYDFQNMLTPLPFVTDLQQGSRFGQLWPISGLSEKIKITTDETEREAIKKQMYHYVDLIVEDIDRYNPSVITIPQFQDPETGEPAKNYYNFLMKHEGFKQRMSRYEFQDTIPFDTSLALVNADAEKIVSHDVFVLKREYKL